MRIRGETILFVELDVGFFLQFFSPESIVKGNTEIRRLCKTKRFRWVWNKERSATKSCANDTFLRIFMICFIKTQHSLKGCKVIIL